MHFFPELVYRGAALTLNALKVAETKTLKALQTSSATPLIKTLQATQLQRVISAVGMFSIFDALLQDRLECVDGFNEAAKILNSQGESDLAERFSNLRCAINVLKHGEGRSYKDLLDRVDALPFRVKRPGERFFEEGDVSEVSTLIEVNDAFVMLCAKTIRDVSDVIRRSRRDFFP